MPANQKGSLTIQLKTIGFPAPQSFEDSPMTTKETGVALATYKQGKVFMVRDRHNVEFYINPSNVEWVAFMRSE